MEGSVVYRPMYMLFPLTAAYPFTYSNPQQDTWRKRPCKPKWLLYVQPVWTL